MTGGIQGFGVSWCDSIVITICWHEPGRGFFGRQNRIRQVLDECLSSRMTLVRRLPPLGTLRAFEAAARHLSFKEAAKELALTPTAISHQVRLLEQYCGK